MALHAHLIVIARASCLLALATAGLLACSSGGGSGSGSAPLVTQTGKAVSYIPCGELDPVAGATITIGAETATTASDGTYSILVPAGTPFTMKAVKTTTPSYIPLIEAEDRVTGSYDRGETLLISSGTASLLTAALPSYNSSKALMTIELVKTGSCTDVSGTTVTVSNANVGALTQYPSQCVSPVGTNPYATDGTFPAASAAVVYNLTPGTQTVTATSPKCTQIPYPYTDPATGLTYDGTVTTEAGTGTSFTRVFLK